MKRILGIFFILIIVIVLLYESTIRPKLFQGNFSNIPTENHYATATIRGHTFTLMLAKTQYEKEKGLGYRASLSNDTGMLFLFDYPDYEAFWMKGMRFPLDILYINSNKIVTIYENLPYPTTISSPLPIVKPTQPADKVLEINAGLATKYHVKTGDYIQISL